MQALDPANPNIDLTDPAWYNAITLTERALSLRAGNGAAPPEPGEEERGLAERRLARWRSERAFKDEPARFARRLAAEGISDETLARLLVEGGAGARDRLPGPPDWLQDVVAAFASTDRAYAMVAPEVALGGGPQPATPAASATTGFLLLVEPLIQRARMRMAEGIKRLLTDYPDAPLDAATFEELIFAHLPLRLSMMVGRTMVLELNVARVQGLLSGSTPEQRFLDFLVRLHTREISLALLKEYPVLVRQVVMCLDQWVRTGLEFLEHLCQDWPELQLAFEAGGAGKLTKVGWGAGDWHREGHAVCILTFDSGFRIVYKPRPLAVDVHFQELLAWLNARGDYPPFRAPRSLDKGSHGWVEFVSARPCSSEEEVRRFYTRQGGYLALLYALRATDFHYENLIASGEDPVLIDLESLFHGQRETDPDRTGLSVAAQALENSVLRVGLLPQRMWGNPQYAAGVELSGLGGAAGQLTPFRVPSWEGMATDEMRLERKQVPVPGAQNRPRLNDAELNALDYTEEIVAGFTAIYRLLLEHRSALLAADGPIARFAGDQIRFIARATRVYATLFEEGFHPDVLRNALDRDRYFDRLWIEVANRPSIERLIADEAADLKCGDIPMFTTLVDSTDLWSSSGHRIPNHFRQSGLEMTRQKIDMLSEGDLASQIWLIRSSMLTLAMGLRRGPSPLSPALQAAEAVEPASPARLAAAARAIGDRLESLALIGGEDEIGWIGLTLLDERYWTIGTAGFDLYGGLPGIGLFLAYLGAETGEARYTRLAERVVRAIRARFKEIEPVLATGSPSLAVPIGAFAELGGEIYFLLHVAVLWRDNGLLDEAEAIVRHLPALIENDTILDIIGGAAGCLGILAAFYRCRPSDSVLAAAVQCGDHLLARLEPMPQGAGWNNGLYGQRPLAGFSHGGAGIAWSLLELFDLTGDVRYRAAAADGFAYERSIFLPECGNWLDLRDMEGMSAAQTPGQPSEPMMVAWCHGAPGIGLSRLAARKHLPGPELEAEIRTALDTTASQGFVENFSLCHGALGNLELLLKAAGVYGNPGSLAEARRAASLVLNGIDSAGWLCGVPLGVETPGLMLGLAGIGYELLRLAYPDRVPSVLLLEAPSWRPAPIGS